jgi:(p)ppGpp synthase/HD superfamily hydrolase
MLKNYFTQEEYEVLKSEENLIYKSLEIVTRLFDDKVDKGGLPYSIHLLKVYSGVSDYIEKVCALLHDVVEDTEVTFDELKEVGYPDEVIEILTLLTKPKGADYQVYIDNIVNSENIHAMNVKLSDLRHNMDLSRIKNPTINDYERVNKRYAPAYTKIQQKIKEMKERENYARH